MTFEVNVRNSTGFTTEFWSSVKDFITYVKLGTQIIRTDKISEMGDKFISVDVFPDYIVTRYRGDDGKDRKINYIYRENVLGFDIDP